MNQATLFNGDDLLTTPRSRKSDHDSSKVAARKHQQSGRADSNRALVLAGLKQHPGKTSKELASLIDMDRVEVHRRLSDMETDGEVVGTREPGKQITWRVSR